MIKVNAVGDACPLPVIKTKKELAKIDQGEVEVAVDNEVAVGNVSRLAESEGCGHSVREEGGNYFITITKDADSQPVNDHSGNATISAITGLEKTVVVISSQFMGSGDDELGALLMKGFVFSLTQLEHLPDTILLYNSGAKLSVNGAPTLADLQSLEAAGVTVKTCGTCLNHFGLAEELAVGSVTNMYDICEEMQSATRTLRP